MPQGPPEDATVPGESAGVPAPPGPRPRTGIAWAVIALVFLAVQAMHFLNEADPGDSQVFAREMMRRQVQLILGAAGIQEDLLAAGGAGAAPRSLLLEQVRSLEAGPVSQRQRFAVVAGEFAGPGKARQVLDTIERLLEKGGRRFEGTEATVQEVLRRLYAGEGPAGNPPALEAGDRALLRENLGWFGDLALAPATEPETAERRAILESGRRLAVPVLVLEGFGLLALGMGFLGALLFLWLLGSGRARLRLGRCSAPGGIYAETFAVWMVLFFGLQAGGGYLWAHVLHGKGILLPATVTTLLSMAALRWPVMRGVPWERVRGDLGLFLSPTPVRDAFAGVACWFMALPVMAGAAVATALLVTFTALGAKKGDPLAPVPFPSHPVLGEITSGAGYLAVFFVASVVAPLVEETFFRGVLYRHLREATGRAGVLPGILLSAAASGLLFAAIHPQGWLLVPLLLSVSLGLVHAREWRGSLLAPVVAHGLHNAVVTAFAFLVLRS